MTALAGRRPPRDRGPTTRYPSRLDPARYATLTRTPTVQLPQWQAVVPDSTVVPSVATNL